MEWIRKIKKALITAGIILGILFVTYLLFQMNKCAQSVPPGPTGELQVTEITYTRPSIKLPFKKYRTPVLKKNLPVPARTVEKSITIQLPGPNSPKVTLVIDKKGRIFRTKDTPEDIDIQVTDWKRPVFELGLDFGYSFVYQGKTFHCFSLDVVRVSDFYLGCEVGLNFPKPEVLIGTSLKYRFGSLEILKKEMKLQALVGYDWIGNKVYIGANMQW